MATSLELALLLVQELLLALDMASLLVQEDMDMVIKWSVLFSFKCFC